MTTHDNSDTSTQLTAETEIAEARARWATRQAAAEEAKREDAQIERQFALGQLANTLPGWMMEYVGQIWSPTLEHDYRIRLNLPGCAPITANMLGNGRVTALFVREPQSVEYSDGKWQVVSIVHTIYGENVDEAINLAASYGESRHEMDVEADRRNAAGEVPQLEPPQPDPIDQAIAVIAKLSRGERIMHQPTASIERNHTADCTLVLSAVGIAIAHHLSRLADAMEARCD